MKVYIRPLSGDVISVEVEEGCSIRQLKQKLETKHGIAASGQHLLLSGVELMDGRSLEDCRITDGASLQLLTNTSNMINIKLLNDKVVPLAVSSLDTITTVKMKLASIMAATTPICAHNVYFRGSVLNNDNTIGSHNIPPMATLRIKDPHFKEINLVLPSKESLKVTLNRYNRKEQLVTLVCAQVIDACGVAPDMDQLGIYHEGQILDPTQLVQDCRLAERATLHLKRHKSKVTTGVISPAFTIVIMAPDCPPIKQEVTSATTIQEVKKGLEAPIGVDLCRIILYHDDAELSNDKSLEEYNITDGTTLRLEELCKLQIISPEGRAFWVDAKSSEMVRDVKKSLESLMEIEHSHLILYYDDVEMEDEKRLTDYSIITGDALLRSDVAVFVCIQAPDQHNIHVKAKQRDTIEALKTLIKKKTGITERQQNLYLGEEKLEEDEGKKLSDYTTSVEITLQLSLEPFHLCMYYQNLPCQEFGPFSMLERASATLDKIAEKISLGEPHRLKLRVEGEVAVDNARWLDLGYCEGEFDTRLAWCRRYEYGEPPTIVVPNDDGDLAKDQLLPDHEAE